MSRYDISTQSIYRVENELKHFENKFEDIKKIVAWRKIRLGEEEFNQFIDAELTNIEDVVNWCYNKIAEIKYTSNEQEFYAILANLELNLNALGQLIQNTENYSEKYSQYCYGTM